MPRASADPVVLHSDWESGLIRHAVFDFDGTLSLIREGWQDVMIPMMVDVLAQHATGETRDELGALVRDYVTQLTGKQTIYQMMELADQVRTRGGVPDSPLAYKHEYLRRLERRISGRLDGLESGTIAAESMLVPGSKTLLGALKDRGVRLYLASGTDEPFVKREAQLLGLGDYFDGGIFGALDDYKRFSKRQVIQKILTDENLRGPELLGVGDGFVEIQNTKEARGVALGVASCESNPYEWDDWKRDRLEKAGADVLTPNFLCHAELTKLLFD